MSRNRTPAAAPVDPARVEFEAELERIYRDVSANPNLSANERAIRRVRRASTHRGYLESEWIDAILDARAMGLGPVAIGEAAGVSHARISQICKAADAHDLAVPRA